MANANAMCTSFKQELLEGVHNFKASGGDTFKIALYSSSSSMDADTTVYSSSNETSGTGYSAGGAVLGNVDPDTSSTTAFTDFDDEVWTTASFTARGALIYNSSDSNKAVVSLDFGADKTATVGTFTVAFPPANSSAAIIRIA